MRSNAPPFAFSSCTKSRSVHQKHEHVLLTRSDSYRKNSQRAGNIARLRLRCSELQNLQRGLKDVYYSASDDKGQNREKIESYKVVVIRVGEGGARLVSTFIRKNYGLGEIVQFHLSSMRLKFLSSALRNSCKTSCGANDLLKTALREQIAPSSLTKSANCASVVRLIHQGWHPRTLKRLYNWSIL